MKYVDAYGYSYKVKRCANNLLNKICVHMLLCVSAYKDLTLSQILFTYVYIIYKCGKFLINDSFIMQENFT